MKCPNLECNGPMYESHHPLLGDIMEYWHCFVCGWTFGKLRTEPRGATPKHGHPAGQRLDQED